MDCSIVTSGHACLAGGSLWQDHENAELVHNCITERTKMLCCIRCNPAIPALSICGVATMPARLAFINVPEQYRILATYDGNRQFMTTEQQNAEEAITEVAT